MNRLPALAFLTLLPLAAPAQALRLIVWDRELQTKLGYGETNGDKMVVQLVKDYSGPVVVLFSRDDDEKARALYPTLKSRYDGTLKGGQLSLDTPNGSLTLARFLAGFRLTLQAQPAGQTLGLPGLRSVASAAQDRLNPAPLPPVRTDLGGR